MTVQTLRGRGMPSLERARRGDLHVHIGVRIPNHLTPEQREQVLELDEHLGSDAYVGDSEGFFQRLRNAFR